MQSYAEIRLRQAHERIAARIEEASIERAAAATRAQSAQPRRQSFRRSIGYSIIRIGERLAAEPSPLRPAQLR